MAIAELIRSLKSKKQTAERTSFQHYLAKVRSLASGDECDSDEVAGILDGAGKSETDLERDVGIQQQRFSWAATMQANQRANDDRRAAESELQAAQQKLQAAVDKLRPAVDAAHDRLNSANLQFQCTMGYDSRLCEHILDRELIEREASLVKRLQAIHSELRPLLEDRTHILHRLGNAEFHSAKLSGRDKTDWLQWGIVDFFHKNQDMRKADSRVDDLQSQLRQLDGAIVPRQAAQSRLQAELTEIHAEKLKP